MHSNILQYLIDSIYHKRYIVFPTEELRNFWCRQLSEHVDIVSLEYCMNSSSVFDFLSRKYLSSLDIQQCELMYSLSRKERHILLSMVLQQKEVQNMLFRLEQIDSANNSISLEEFSQNYVLKFEALLQAYHLILHTCSDNDFFVHCIEVFYASYVQILTKSNCIDTLVLPTLLVKQHICIDDMFVFLFPQLLSNEQQSRFLYLYQNEVMNSMCFFQDISNRKQNDTMASAYTEHKSNDAPYTQCSFSDYMEYMQTMSVSAYSQKTIKKFMYTRQELHYVCKSIQEKLTSVEPHSIAITLCDNNPTIIEDIYSTAKQYGIVLQDIHMVQHFPLLEHMWQLYSKGCTVHTLQNLFMDPRIPWKQRAMHVRIVQLGYEKIPNDSNDLSLWKKVLAREVKKNDHLNEDNEQHTHGYTNNIDENTDELEAMEHRKEQRAVHTLTIYEYFFSIQHMFRTIVQASSFVELRESVHVLIDTYMCQDALEGIVWLKQLYETLDDYVVLSKHMEQTYDNFEKEIAKSPFHVLRAHLTQYRRHDSDSHTQSSVALCVFPHSLYCEYAYQYYIGCNQNAFARVLSKPTFFHEMLSKRYMSDALQQRYEKRNQYIQSSLDYCSDTVAFSFSAQSPDGVQPDPAFWNNIEPAFVVDTFQKEQQYWEKLCSSIHTHNNKERQGAIAETETSFCTISSVQKQGLEYQQHIQSATKNASFFTHAVDKKVREKYQRNLTHKNVHKKSMLHSHIHPSNLSLVLENPMVYMLNNVFQIRELFAQNIFLYSERMLFSSLIHETFAHMASMVAKHIQTMGDSGAIDSQSQLDVLLSLVPDIVAEGKALFMQRLVNESLYFFMQQSIEHAFDEVLLYRFMSVLLYALYTQKSSIHIIEESIDFDLSEIMCNDIQFPPFVLQGKPDLCFSHQGEEYYSFFDYKLRKSTNAQMLERYFTQLWAYHVLVSKHTHFLFYQMSSIKEDNDATAQGKEGGTSTADGMVGYVKGALYYIADSYKDMSLYNTVFPVPQALHESSSLHMLDYIEQTLQKYNSDIGKGDVSEYMPSPRTQTAMRKRTEKIHMFLSTIEENLLHALSSVYQLDFSRLFVDTDTDVKNKKESIVENFIVSLILREQCFIYRNRD